MALFNIVFKKINNNVYYYYYYCLKHILKSNCLVLIFFKTRQLIFILSKRANDYFLIIKFWEYCIST